MYSPYFLEGKQSLFSKSVSKGIEELFFFVFRSGDGDSHNETTVSEASQGDITLDSVKDHIVTQALELTTTECVTGNRTERVETVSRTVETVSVTRLETGGAAAGGTTEGASTTTTTTGGEES